MEYLKPRFTVPVGSDKFRENHDAVFERPPRKCSWCTDGKDADGSVCGVCEGSGIR